MSIRLPRLLDPTGQERCRLYPSRLSLSLRLSPLSTAEMTLPPEEPPVAVRDLVELYDENGSVGIFRVSAIDEEIGRTRRIHLEHGLATLADGLLPAMNAEGLFRTTMEQILSNQPTPMWQLGDIDLPEDAVLLYTTGTTNLLTALLDILPMLPEELMLVYDQASFPWTLHLRRMPDTGFCEGRLSRNLTGVRIDTDGSSLCTRVYPYGAGSGMDRISIRGLVGQDYMDSPSAAELGIISRTFIAATIYDSATLKAVAEKYLERHSVPTVSVTAEAIDLAAVTGESADSFRLGQMCRLALPDAGRTLTERIIGLNKPDVFGQPGLTDVLLCNRIHDASDELADMLREVIADQTLGGQVGVTTTSNRANGTPNSPVVHYFRIEDGQSVLSCKAHIDPDGSVGIKSLSVDSNKVPNTVSTPMTCDLTPYLRRTDSGTIATGRHYLTMYPHSDVAIHSTVTVRVIETP